MSFGLFSAENSTVTVGSLDRRAVDHKHEQQTGDCPRNRGLPFHAA